MCVTFQFCLIFVCNMFVIIGIHSTICTLKHNQNRFKEQQRFKADRMSKKQAKSCQQLAEAVANDKPPGKFTKIEGQGSHGSYQVADLTNEYRDNHRKKSKPTPIVASDPQTKSAPAALRTQRAAATASVGPVSTATARADISTKSAVTRAPGGPAGRASAGAVTTSGTSAARASTNETKADNDELQDFDVMEEDDKEDDDEKYQWPTVCVYW